MVTINVNQQIRSLCWLTGLVSVSSYQSEQLAAIGGILSAFYRYTRRIVALGCSSGEAMSTKRPAVRFARRPASILKPGLNPYDTLYYPGGVSPIGGGWDRIWLNGGWGWVDFSGRDQKAGAQPLWLGDQKIRKIVARRAEDKKYITNETIIFGEIHYVVRKQVWVDFSGEDQKVEAQPLWRGAQRITKITTEYIKNETTNKTYAIKNETKVYIGEPDYVVRKHDESIGAKVNRTRTGGLRAWVTASVIPSGWVKERQIRMIGECVYIDFQSAAGVAVEIGRSEGVRVAIVAAIVAGYGTERKLVGRIAKLDIDKNSNQLAKKITIEVDKWPLGRDLPPGKLREDIEAGIIAIYQSFLNRILYTPMEFLG